MRISKLILSVLLFVSAGVLSSAGIDKMFIHRSAGNESIYFIFKQNIPANNDTKSFIKSVEYDYTIVQKSDSVFMLVTLEVPKTIKETVVKIGTDKEVYSYIPELIFADPKGHKFIYRYRIGYPFAVFDQVYESINPFCLSFYCKVDNIEKFLYFKYNEKKWKTNREKMLSIIELIKLNSGKL